MLGSQFFARNGPVAQLGERHVRNVEVVGSIPIRSTISKQIVKKSEK